MDFPRLSAYLAELARNNYRDWFEAHRPEYQALRDDFTAFVGEVIADLARVDDRVTWVDPKDCLFRIYRDTRFSGDKRPYKTTFSAAISERGRKSESGGWYFEVDQEGTLFCGGGIYMPDSDRLARIRASIAEHPERLEAVLSRRAFRSAFGGLWGEALTRPPRGYTKDTPGIKHIKRKHFFAGRERDAKTVDHDEARAWIGESFRTLQPLVLWLQTAMAPRRLDDDEDADDGGIG